MTSRLASACSAVRMKEVVVRSGTVGRRRTATRPRPSTTILDLIPIIKGNLLDF